MSTFDIILLIPIAFGAYQGFRRGFLLEVIAILAFILAVIGGFKLLHMGMDFLDSHFDISGQWLPFLSFILIFILIILSVNLLGKGLKKVIDLTILGVIDNIAGLIISVLKWAFGLSVVLWLLDAFGANPPEEWITGSILYPIILPLAPKVVDYLAGLMPFAHELFD
ncbi:MAG: CvpA family protein, partial [Fulvivirga sp.]|nr:CvpA family protein [Fulvivirga sp.]